MSEEMSRLLDQVVPRRATRMADDVEAMCERMLVDPRGWGVLVHHRMYIDRLGFTQMVELSSRVPLYDVQYHNVLGDADCETCSMYQGER